jgi:hypothetical protein
MFLDLLGLGFTAVLIHQAGELAHRVEVALAARTPVEAMRPAGL